MAVVGCQEVQGACLEGCLGKACGGFGGFGGFDGFEGFGGFEGGQTAALNALKNRWPWCLAGGRANLEGLKGLRGLRGLRAGKRQP